MWDFRWMSAGIVLFVVLVSITVGLLAQPRAQAKATILLATPPQNSVLAPNIQGDASLARYSAQRAAIVTSDEMLVPIAKSLAAKNKGASVRSITSLRRDLSAVPSSTSNAIIITAKGDSPAKAVQLATAAVSAYRSETVREVQGLTNAAVKSIEASAARIQYEANLGSPSARSSEVNTLSQLAVQASQLRTSSALYGDGVESVVAPRTDAVTRPSLPLREAALGVVLGLVIAATVAWIRADDDDSESDEHDHSGPREDRR